jgi:hypothetical protein
MINTDGADGSNLIIRQVTDDSMEILHFYKKQKPE